MESLDKFGTELRQFSQLMTFTSMAVLSIEDQNLGSSLNSSPVQVQVPWQFSYINLPVVLTKDLNQGSSLNQCPVPIWQFCQFRT